MSLVPLSEITLPQFWMGRDTKYPDDLTDIIRENAMETVRRANELLAAMLKDGVVPARDVTTQCAVASGWRPPAVNSTTSNAAKNSPHQRGLALDIRDDAHQRNLCRWALAHQAALGSIGLWCERPQWTPSWLHIQTLPPGSGKRFFIPSTSAPLVDALPGEE